MPAEDDLRAEANLLFHDRSVEKHHTLLGRPRQPMPLSFDAQILDDSSDADQNS
jgi:hypothetical protein